MPLPLWVWILGGAVVIRAAESKPKTASVDFGSPFPAGPGPRPERLEKPPTPKAAKEPGKEPEPEPGDGLKVWGTHLNSTDAYWNPRYLKYKGVQKFRWGVCFEAWIDELAKQDKAAGVVRDVTKAIWKVLEFLFASVKTVKNILDRACVRFSFPLRRWEDAWGNKGWTIHVVSGAQDDRIAPPFPMPPRQGLLRCWISVRRKNSSRTPTVLSVFFPSSEGVRPEIHEMTYTSMVRALLRMADKTPGGAEVGSLRAKELASAAEGDSRWWIATRKNAMEEFK